MPYPPIHRTFAEQLDFFRQKLNLPTEVWDDIERAANDRGFIVAGAQGSDLLYDLRGAVDKAIEQGTGLEQFRKDFAQIVARHGWTGWTGEGTKGGEAWRTKVIYQTNMATSYAAGRWQQLTNPELLKVSPYWQYHHMDGLLYPRPLHESWDGLTLHWTHPFWKTHFPTNGWGCHCWVTAVTKEKYMLAIASGKGQPPEGWDAIDPKTGTPVGIDKGFDYAPGAGVDTPLRRVVQDKLITYPPAITTALSRDVNRYINAQQLASTFAREVLADTTRIDPLWLGFVENFDRVMEVANVDTRGYMVLLPADAPRHAETVHGYDGGSQRAPTPEDYNWISLVLAEADSLVIGDVSDRGLTRVVAFKQIGGELFRCVFEVRPGKRNMALVLISLVIKL